MLLPEPVGRLITWPVNIGAAARQSGVSAKMIRHYESLALLPAVNRTESGYRLYTQADVHTLRFIRRCRELGFPMKDIASLVNLWHDQHRSSANVQDIARRHLDTLAERIAGLQAMQRTLQDLIGSCHGDERPECPILDELANAGHTATPGAG
ncbi:MAG: Cu(I)-responsive transcriptional regulator [Burkholderiales bacterium]|nr:Cu(I)-responsive transcriptional regulator [Burkholderiales bacterium]